MRLAAALLLLVGGCRIGYDPVDHDAGVIVDADVTVDSTPFVSEGIRCGDDVCDDALQKCCHDEVGPGGTCAAPADSCDDSQSDMECDDPGDCADALCCAYIDPGGELTGAACEPSCDDGGPRTPLILCLPASADTCPTGRCEFSAERNFFYCQ